MGHTWMGAALEGEVAMAGALRAAHFLSIFCASVLCCTRTCVSPGWTVQRKRLPSADVDS